jgi:Dockerin type I domain/Bacterial Ig-like domain
MYPSRELPRKRRERSFSIDRLEDRTVMSAGMGSTFAIVPGSITTAGQTSTAQIKIDPEYFTGGKGGRLAVGIDIAADPNSTVKPQIVAVRGANGRPLPIQHSVYSQALVKSKSLGTPISSAITTTLVVPAKGLAAANYQIEVKGLSSTTGDYLLGFYLPGDANGDGSVDQTDIKAIISQMGQTSSSANTKYTFDADANRDGKITGADLRMAMQNLGAKTTISPVVNVNLDPASDGPLHSRVTNMRNVHFTGAVTPNAQVTFAEINKNSPGATTTADATGNYSIMVPLGDGSNTFKVTTADAFGQSISGQISPVTWSANPPTVINTPPKTS